MPQHLTPGTTEAQFLEQLSAQELVLVDAFATWCEPCAMLDSILEELEPRIQGLATILKMDVDEQPELSAALGIRSVPTLMVFRRGVLSWRMAGFKLAHELQADLERIAAGEV
jgi:thioredoxin 1